jgi:hypothetical protein
MFCRMILCFLISRFGTLLSSLLSTSLSDILLQRGDHFLSASAVAFEHVHRREEAEGRLPILLLLLLNLTRSRSRLLYENSTSATVRTRKLVTRS